MPSLKLTPDQQKAYEKDWITNEVRHYQAQFQPFDEVMRPLVLEDAEVILVRTEDRGIFCDGFQFPRVLPMKPNEVHTYLLSMGLNVSKPTVT